MTEALTVVDQDTGEVLNPVTVKRFDFTEYLDRLSTPAAIKAQQSLMAAYDAAVRSLIGPNDVQREGSREFKKKSAWRKLARHFGISTRVMVREHGWIQEPGKDAEFVASVTVRAIAPWGQESESVGACGTDEETGRRVITIADAIATAETRATNRAVSNLIAMGEVSAEEMQKGKTKETPTAIPFGKDKGKLLTDCTDEHLADVKRWCQEKGKFTELVEAIDRVLEERREAAGAA